MAALARDAAVCDGGRRVTILGSGDRWSHAARVTREAVGNSRKVKRNLPSVLVRGGHIPKLLLGVPVDGRFKQEAVSGEEISASRAIGPDVVLQFALAF